MAKPLQELLTPEKALIFRVTHRANLPWLFRHGLHCRRSEIRDPEFVSIGNSELIEKRSARTVPIPPGGTLDDYVPFYFTPYTPMLLNITTGHGGIKQRANEDLVFLVSSLETLEENGLRYVFTDRHAYLRAARFFGDRQELRHVDFELLRRRDFQRDPEDPAKLERYQAEALVHRHLPVTALLGAACHSRVVQQGIDSLASELGVRLRPEARPSWYFG
jgi:hypothetical protein